jgi:tRNA (guanine37-N1)-methyltransferase
LKWAIPMYKSENDEELFIKLNKSNAQEFLSYINLVFKKKPIINQKIKILYESKHILFPLINDDVLIEELKNTINDNIEYELLKFKGTINPKFKHKSIIDVLKGDLKEEFLDFIPKSYDIIGDIAIIEIDDVKSLNKQGLAILKKKIARALTLVNKNVKSVYEKKSKIKGSYRLRELHHLYGENRTKTIHKENNFVFNLDLSQVFFTPRLVFERKRIASSSIQEREIIVDLFAGVGPFSIQIAKNHDVIIHSFDVNPRAYEQLKENITLNRMKGEIIPHNLDVKTLLEPTNELGASLKNNVDRVIMNLPEKSIEFIDVACYLLKKSGGIIHSYQFSDKPDAVEKAINNLQESIASQNWVVENIIGSKIVKHFSPKAELIAVDLKIMSL